MFGNFLNIIVKVYSSLLRVINIRSPHSFASTFFPREKLIKILLKSINFAQPHHLYNIEINLYLTYVGILPCHIYSQPSQTASHNPRTHNCPSQLQLRRSLLINTSQSVTNRSYNRPVFMRLKKEKRNKHNVMLIISRK